MKEFNITWDDHELKLGNNGKLLIGRNPGSDIFVSDRRLSREHAYIIAEDGILFLEDLGSSNGTLVNNKLVTGPTQLKNNDTIVAGPVQITVKVNEELGELPTLKTPKPSLASPPAAPPPQQGKGGGKCPHCEFSLAPGAKFCPGCGIPIDDKPADEANDRRCRKCGADLIKGAVFCPGCGNSINEFFMEKPDLPGIGPRLMAGVIDFVITAAIFLVLAVLPTLLGILAGPGFTAENMISAEHLSVVIPLVAGLTLAVIVCVLFFTYAWGIKGASPGMKFTGIEVTLMNKDARIGGARGLVRALLFLPSFPGWFFVFLTPQKQALHDIISGGYVKA